MRLLSFYLSILGLITWSLATTAPVSTCRPGSEILSGRVCKFECGINHPAGDYRNAKLDDFELCAKACAADPICVAATYHFDSGFCYLKNQLNPGYPGTVEDSIVCAAPITTTTTSTTSTTTKTSTTSTTTSTTSTTSKTSTTSTTSTTSKTSTTSTTPTTTSTTSTTSKTTTTSTTTSTTSTTTKSTSSTTRSTSSTTKSTSSTSKPTTSTTKTTTRSTTKTTSTSSTPKPTPTCKADVDCGGGCDCVYVFRGNQRRCMRVLCAGPRDCSEEFCRNHYGSAARCVQVPSTARCGERSTTCGIPTCRNRQVQAKKDLESVYQNTRRRRRSPSVEVDDRL